MKADRANYPRNCWWVAATTDELLSTPVGRLLLDDPVVLFRLGDGTAVALEDRCPHRWAPLSAGQVIGDSIVCRYHGARFEADGTCSKVPTQHNIPGKARVRSYPLIEQDGVIWIWMGDPVRREGLAPPRLEFNNGGAWWSMGGYMPVEANYFALQENVLDLTHFGFLHADTLAQDGWEDARSTVEVAEGTVTYRKAVEPTPVAPFINVALGLPGQPDLPREDWGSFLLPSAHVAGIDFADPRLAEGTARDRHFRIAHLTTPMSSDRTHYWWIEAQDYGDGTPEQRSLIREMVEMTFAQDKDILEATQRLITSDRRGRDAPEVSFISDRPGLNARKILQDMLARDDEGYVQQQGRETIDVA